MRWRGAQTTIVSALTILLLAVGIWHAASKDRAGDPVRAAARAGSATAAARGASARVAPQAPSDPADPSALYATVGGSPTGSALPAGFLGLSFEYGALQAYSGAEPAALDPVFVQLLRNLGQPLVLRIGGNSTDATWWPVRGVSRPPGVSYALTPAWLASARALVNELGAKVIVGVNLAAARPRLSAAEADALVQWVGAGHIAALELGNEPDVYALFPWYRGRRGPVYARSSGYGPAAFTQEARNVSALLPSLPLAGPATAKLPWLAGVPALAAAEPGLRVVTVHRYALQGCLSDASSPAYPSIDNLLSDRSSAGLAQALAPYIAMAHARGLSFRVDELNSAALAGCLGRAGVSDTFASALWMLDVLFNLARVGVDGVNVHSLPGAGYELFTLSRDARGWHAFVHPDYYAMLLFAQAFPAGARLLPVHAPAGPVKVWGTLAPDGHTRVALINKSPVPQRVELQLPPAAGSAEVELLRAPGAWATGGVTLGGQSFGAQTTTGALPGPGRLEPVPQLFGWYTIRVPADSAALLTR